MDARMFEIRISGTLTPEALQTLGDVQPLAETPLTVLRGRVPDQAALHGLLLRLHDLGLDVIEVRRLPQPPAGGGRP
jgi:hypothetical protein